MTDDATKTKAGGSPRLSEGLGGADVQAAMREFPGLMAEAEHFLRGLGRHRGEWPGKRKLFLCATVPWHRQPRGRRARKAAFAHNARKLRRYMAATKTVLVACGKYHLPPQQSIPQDIAEIVGRNLWALYDDA